MPKVDNLLAILWMLSTGKKITANEISEKLEINIRTVYRYIDTLSTSGVPIISDSGHNGGYTLMTNFIQAPLFFDNEEQTSLYHAAVFAEEAGYYGGEALSSAVSKLSKYSNQEQERKISQRKASLEVINQKSSFSAVPLLKELEQAVADRYAVNIQYHKSSEEQSKFRLIEPYTIIYWKTNWYVIGFCHLRNDIRSFKVKRIDTIIQTEYQFNKPKDFSAREFFLKNILPTMDDKEEIISLVINGNKNTLDEICQHWFLENYLHERTPNQAIFLLEKEILNTYVPHMILPYGKSIQVQEPISLKERLIEILSDLIKFHEK
ncbi:YafY family protein [Cytobacillus sp. IB215665]|uniref:helix-turn-helix transcriptional regulator n=1 Tax=Cytobacillus sp. IB215665 TaxID=3097357 RepID=UPI002A11A8D7|nr:YafY family protein [Cytobacillus sp. IB215665]MDX8366316.1 YafY family protein [Cytobacillus sp. IB215665]